MKKPCLAQFLELQYVVVDLGNDSMARNPFLSSNDAGAPPTFRVDAARAVGGQVELSIRVNAVVCASEASVG